LAPTIEKPYEPPRNDTLSPPIEIAVREADETLYWLELLAESETIKPKLLRPLIDETNQLIAILTATVKSAKKRSPKSQITNHKS